LKQEEVSLRGIPVEVRIRKKADETIE